jgi:hypothetical protein
MHERTQRTAVRAVERLERSLSIHY